VTGVGGGSLSTVETVNADLSGGNDQLSYGGATTDNITVDLAAGTATGFAAISGVENVTSGSGNDLLVGDMGANSLNGGTGNDTLMGGLGFDTLTGGTGIDTVSYANETDAMVVNLALNTAGRAPDAAVEDVLSGIENAIGGVAGDTITGSTAGNLLGGGAGDDSVDGGTGNDVITGGASNDLLAGGLGDDTFTYVFGDGADVFDDDALSVSNALALGVKGYILKGVSGSELINALQTIHSGLPFLTPDLASRLLIDTRGGSKPNLSRGSPIGKSRYSSGYQKE
jgi:Ca2+-binding RTX toxin-like protein